MSNRGAAGAVFYVYNLGNLSAAPKKYTVEGTKVLSDVWPLSSLMANTYNLSLHGPNGFVRKFGGSYMSAATATITYLARSKEVAVSVSGSSCAFRISDNAYGTYGGPWPVASGGNVTIPVGLSANWYDLSVSPELRLCRMPCLISARRCCCNRFDL
jgi:phospholipase C